MNLLQFFSKNRYMFLVALSFFFLLEIVIISTVKYLENIDKSHFLENKAKELNVQMQMGKHYLNEMAEVLYDTMLNDPKISEIMYQATQTTDLQKEALLRAELYKTLQEKYKYMKKLGVRQLHFHVPGAVSFLRFHRVEKFGDSLAAVRESLMYVNKYKEPIECFEEGRIFNGFRHVYPLFYNKEFVGSVEISYSFKAFLDHMLEINPNASYIFLMNNEVIDTKVFDDEKSNYMKSDFDSYSIDKNTLSNSMGISLDEIFTINKKIKKHILKNLENQEDFTVDTFIGQSQNKSIIVSFIGIKNFEEKKVAYMIGYSYSMTMDIFNKRATQMALILTFVNFVLTLLLIILFRKEKLKAQRASEEAIRDPLTGVLNRRGFNNILDYKISISRRYDSDMSVMFFDIDHFKDVNDNYGHDVGDTILQELSNVIKACIRESDIFARWGGEEFIIVLPQTSMKDAVVLAEKLQKEIKKYNFTKVETLTCSFGVTQLQDDESSDELLKRVDELLYLAKTTGRDRVISDTERSTNLKYSL
ncbi:sensor domain-containing diguanylate cyclase [Sulfurimonas marina]|uniref:diguanylate cyclase n=1 Tax=Sulfurimonas marina TaxID=2590551 RepID=A0A7M3V966_9BACT|nr:diguanylate cyclase [Sulfurimonas marina]QOP40299.1 diguanylate cyclase [Sulfurimonas marina]